MLEDLIATIVSTGFEHGLTPGGIGISTLNTPANISLSTAWAASGTKSLLVTGTASASVFAAATISQAVISGVFAFKPSGLPASAIAIVRGQQPSHTFNLNLNPNGKLQPAIGGSTGTSGTTVLVAGTAYAVAFRFDASTTTHKIDWTLYDSSGSSLETGTQQTASSTAANLTSIQFGQNGSVSLTIAVDDITVTNQSADHPLTPRAGDDGTYAPITTYPTAWLDHPTWITGGQIFGLMTMNTGSGDNGQAALSESSSKANRTNWITQSFYSNITTIPTLLFEQSVQQGTLLGHYGWPMIQPFGFGSTTVNWPSGGMADFANGSLDATLDSWCTLLEAQLPLAPFLLRPFREMTNNVTIYGPNGSSVGGKNETGTSFVAGWNHVYDYIHSRVEMARFVWCADSVQAPSISAEFMPDDDHLDWVGVDGYKTSGNGYTLAALKTWHDAFAPGGAYETTKPMMVCETSVQAADPNRIVDIESYKAQFTAMDAFKAVCFWDSSATGPYYISDSPTGFLSAFQTLVGAAPFTGDPTTITEPPPPPPPPPPPLDARYQPIVVLSPDAPTSTDAGAAWITNSGTVYTHRRSGWT